MKRYQRRGRHDRHNDYDMYEDNTDDGGFGEFLAALSKIRPTRSPTPTPSAPKILNKNMPPIEKCKALLNYLYDYSKGKNGHITHKNRVEFSSIVNMAQDYERAGHPDKAIEVYRYMCEYIIEHIGIVDDMKKYYTGEIQKFMTRIIALSHKRQFKRDDRHNLILRLFKRYILEDSHFFAQMYLETFYDVIKDSEDGKYGASLFTSQIGKEPIVPKSKSRRDGGDILSAAVQALEKSGGVMLTDFLMKYHMQNKSICTRYIWQLADVDVQAALQVARDAEERFADPDHFLHMQEFILEQSGEPGLADLLRRMFVMTTNWTYYEKIKSTSNGWSADLHTILDDLRKADKPHVCIDVLLYEKRTKEALAELQKIGNLDMFDAYSKEFAARYSEQYYTAYKEQIPSMIEVAKNTYDYENIQRHIDVMRTIPEHGAGTEDLLADIESKHPQFAEWCESKQNAKHV